MNKTTLLIAILALGLLPGLSPKADAQHYRQQSHVFVSGYQRCGTPIYMVRYIAGYERCGRAIWRVRHLNHHERSRYCRSQHRSDPRYSGYGESRIHYSTSSGRGFSYRHYGSQSRCANW